MPPESVFDDLSSLLIPESEVAAMEKARPKKPVRLKRLPSLFVRVPMTWLTTSARPCAERLFLYLVFKSHWGQRSVKLTSAMVAEIGVSDRLRQRCIHRWEVEGWVRVERSGSRAAPSIRPLVIAG
jgi:hypothetical protein